jgi:hypothetical protein
MKRQDIFNAIGELPTTQIRVLVTTGLAVATTIKYLSSDTWVPDAAWLVFLGGMAGLDVAQWTAKRVTHRSEYYPSEDEESDDVSASTDIQEQYGNQLG